MRKIMFPATAVACAVPAWAAASTEAAAAIAAANRIIAFFMPRIIPYRLAVRRVNGYRPSIRAISMPSKRSSVKAGFDVCFFVSNTPGEIQKNSLPFGSQPKRSYQA